MRVAVANLLGGQQQPAALQVVDDLGIRVEHQDAVQPVLPDAIGEEPPVVAHRVEDLEVVLPADVVVLRAVARCGVHAAGAGVERDVIAQDQHAGTRGRARGGEIGALDGGVGADPCLVAAHELGTGEARDLGRFRPPQRLAHRGP